MGSFKEYVKTMLVEGEKLPARIASAKVYEKGGDAYIDMHFDSSDLVELFPEQDLLAAAKKADPKLWDEMVKEFEADGAKGKELDKKLLGFYFSDDDTVMTAIVVHGSAMGTMAFSDIIALDLKDETTEGNKATGKALVALTMDSKVWTRLGRDLVKKFDLKAAERALKKYADSLDWNRG
jgi:hypothetical protein